MDAVSADRLGQQNQFPEHANDRTLPRWLFDARQLATSRPDAVLRTRLVTPIPIKSKPPSTPRLQQVQHA